MIAGDDYKLLSEVYNILKEENVFDFVEGEPVINFKHPPELLKEIDFKLTNKTPSTLDEVRKLCHAVIKNSVKTNNPNFHFIHSQGYDPFGLAASWILEALNTFPSTYEISPVFTLMENSVLDKLLTLFGIPEGEGLFTPGGSIANMCGLVMARHRACPEAREKGLYGQQELVAFTSRDCHFSFTKSAIWLGIGKDNLVAIDTDHSGKMCTERLEEAILDAIANGKRPFFVNATTGTTVLGAFDDIQKISGLCKKYNMWFHIDASFGGHAIVSSRHKHLLKGCDQADSIAYCPQKLGGAPLHCAVALFKKKGLLDECNALKAAYLFQQDKYYDVWYDTGDKGIQNSKKADGFKLWLMYKARGNAHIEKAANNAWDCSRYLTNQMKNHPGFRLVLDHFECTNVCFWFIPPSMRGKEEDEEWWQRIFRVTLIVQERMIKKGHFMVAYSSFKEKGLGNFFRLTIVSYPPPTTKHMDALISEIEGLGKDL